MGFAFAVHPESIHVGITEWVTALVLDPTQQFLGYTLDTSASHAGAIRCPSGPVESCDQPDPSNFGNFAVALAQVTDYSKRTAACRHLLRDTGIKVTPNDLTRQRSAEFRHSTGVWVYCYRVDIPTSITIEVPTASLSLEGVKPASLIWVPRIEHTVPRVAPIDFPRYLARLHLREANRSQYVQPVATLFPGEGEERQA